MTGSSPFFPDSDASTGGHQQPTTPTHGYSLSESLPQPRSKTHRHTYGMQQPRDVPEHSYGQVPPAPAAAYVPPTPSDQIITGESSISFSLALSAGARRMHTNPIPWLLLAAIPVAGAGVILFFLSALRSLSMVLFVVATGITLVLLVVTSMVSATVSYRGALNEMDLRRPTFKEFFRDSRWGKVIRTGVLVQLVYLMAFIPEIVCLVIAATLIEPADLGSSNVTTAIVLAFVIGPIITLILSIWFAPTARLMPLAGVDQNIGAFDAFSAAAALVTGRYWRIYGSLLLINLLRLSGFLLCGLGVLYTFPVARLAEAHLYRQLSGGPRPAPLDPVEATEYPNHQYAYAAGPVSPASPTDYSAAPGWARPIP